MTADSAESSSAAMAGFMAKAAKASFKIIFARMAIAKSWGLDWGFGSKVDESMSWLRTNYM
jgi:hypothetical protein